MKPFTFRLAQVLALWHRREDAAHMALQRHQAATAAARLRAHDAARARQAALDDAGRCGASTSAAHELTWHRNWIELLSVRLAGTVDATRRCEAAERAALAAWQKARRDRRTMERLRDRARQRYAVDVRRREAAAMDAVAQQAAAREQRRGGQ